MQQKNPPQSAEHKRLLENATKEIPVERWGSYLSERQWSTVREDYSANGDPWSYLTHDHARSKAYRWGEDGLGGISDRSQFICFAFAFWNGKDPILKERLFGLTNEEGNHGEDCKELYYYLDNLPTHSYMKFLYKYPQGEFPYNDIVQTNAARNKFEKEYELLDTGIFDEGKYFDITIEYAKSGSEDISIRLTIKNHSNETAPITILPTIWFRNTWQVNETAQKPAIFQEDNPGSNAVVVDHPVIGKYHFHFDDGASRILFTENETNTEKLYNQPNDHPYKKDAFHEVVVKGNTALLDGKTSGTKFAPVYQLEIEGSSTRELFFRISQQPLASAFKDNIEAIFTARQAEADEFYSHFLPAGESEDKRNIQRQAFAGLLWNKQFYHYDVEEWLDGDRGKVIPPFQRLKGRNSDWRFLNNRDIILMPDSWEYPWYAAWDLAFHCVPMAFIDPVFAKNQLILIMREWYMSPQGQIPAYEWNFSDVNPPVHAWAALSVYHIDKKRSGQPDVDFLKRVFSKLTINFTWWVNRKDHNGNNIFEGGFLGLDNIGIINRSELPYGYALEQVDGTCWMATFALSMMEIALEICQYDRSYEDIVTKFYEHYIMIAESLDEAILWNAEDGFYYDVLITPQMTPVTMKIHSAVGLCVMFATGIIHRSDFDKLPDLEKRIKWYKHDRERKNKYLPYERHKEQNTFLTTLIKEDKLVRILQRLLHEHEFLSQGGIRSLSKFHENNPVHLNIEGTEFSIRYDPAESTSSMFGGNSNWRGPVWFPINYLLIKSLKKYHQFYGDSLKVQFPSESGNWMNLDEVSNALANRLVSIFQADESGNRPVHADHAWFYSRPENRDLILFYEYFHGDTLQGLGASHQTGWTAVVAELINNEKWEWD